MLDGTILADVMWLVLVADSGQSADRDYMSFSSGIDFAQWTAMVETVAGLCVPTRLDLQSLFRVAEKSRCFRLSHDELHARWAEAKAQHGAEATGPNE